MLEAWLRLGHHVRTHRVTTPTVLTRLVWWWAAPLLFAPVLFSRDVYSYIAQSRLMADGNDPYSGGVLPTYFVDGVDPMWRRPRPPMARCSWWWPAAWLCSSATTCSWVP